MKEKINKTYRPSELSAAILALADCGMTDEDAVTLIKKLFEKGYRVVKS